MKIKEKFIEAYKLTFFGTPCDTKSKLVQICAHIYTKERSKQLLEVFWPYRTNIRAVKNSLLFSLPIQNVHNCSTKTSSWNFQNIARETSVPEPLMLKLKRRNSSTNVQHLNVFYTFYSKLPDQRFTRKPINYFFCNQNAVSNSTTRYGTFSRP